MFQLYMWWHRCAIWLKKLYLRSDSQRHRHFVGFFNVPVLHRHGTTLFVPRFRESVGTLNLIRPSVTKTLTLAITFALLQIELWYLACVFLVTRPFRWYHVVTLTVTFDLLQGQICCRAGDHNFLNLLLYGYSEKPPHLVAFYYTLGIRRTNCRLKPPAPQNKDSFMPLKCIQIDTRLSMFTWKLECVWWI